MNIRHRKSVIQLKVAATALRLSMLAGIALASAACSDDPAGPAKQASTLSSSLSASEQRLHHEVASVSESFGFTLWTTPGGTSSAMIAVNPDNSISSVILDIVNGTPPYTYEWRFANNPPFYYVSGCGASDDSCYFFVHHGFANSIQYLVVRVTDAVGNSKQAHIMVKVGMNGVIDSYTCNGWGTFTVNSGSGPFTTYAAYCLGG